MLTGCPTFDGTQPRQPLHQQSNGGPGLGVRPGVAYQHPGYSRPMSQACSRSFFEYALNAVRVCVDLIPGTTVTSSVTILAIASCSATSTIATRSHSPETEKTCETTSIPASLVAHSAIRFGSALISTMAVIMSAPMLLSLVSGNAAEGRHITIPAGRTLRHVAK